MNWVICTIIALVFYAVGEYYAKIYANTGKINVVILAMIAYMACVALWFPALKGNNKLVLMGTIWTVGYALIGLVIGTFLFQEHCTIKQYVGIGLGILSILLICFE